MHKLLFIKYYKGFGVIDDVIGPQLTKTVFSQIFNADRVTTQMTTTPCRDFRLDSFVNV